VEDFKQGLPLDDATRPSQWSAWLPGRSPLPCGPRRAFKAPRVLEEDPTRFGYRIEKGIPLDSIIETAKCELTGKLPVYSHMYPAPRSLGQWERMTVAPSLGANNREYSLYPNRIFNDYTKAQVRLEVALYEDLCFAIRNRELLRVQDVSTLRSKIYSYSPNKGYTKYNPQKVTIKDYGSTGVLGHLVRLFLRGKKRNLSIRDKLLVGMDGLATPKAIAKFTRSHLRWK
jgi:hypothetical protein